MKIKMTLVGLFLAFLVIQWFPYAHDHKNPRIVAEPAWDSPITRELARRACFDCHSNETVWPVYARFAPVSWLVYSDVMEGREKLNFSEWNRPQKEAGKSADEIREGEMPMPIYLLMHGSAKLNAAEQQALITGIEKTLGIGK